MVWLGAAAENSEHGMSISGHVIDAVDNFHLDTPHRFIEQQTRHNVAAFNKLMDWEYWKRAWIVQEFIHARKLEVWCGDSRIVWLKDLAALSNDFLFEDKRLEGTVLLVSPSTPYQLSHSEP